jgi:hypothetical protein
LPAQKLRAGDADTVVHVYDGAKEFEVEFVTGSGETLALETLSPTDIRLLVDHEILHSRNVAAA